MRGVPEAETAMAHGAKDTRPSCQTGDNVGGQVEAGLRVAQYARPPALGRPVVAIWDDDSALIA